MGACIGPCHPTRAIHRAFLAFLSRAFGFQDPKWFYHHAPAFYAPTDENFRNQWIFLSDGKPVAHVGIFPFSLKIFGRTLSAGGIGGVATDPAFRGHGLMQRLMQHADEDMCRRGFALGILWGDRKRYRYWGYESALFLPQFFFTGRSLAALSLTCSAVRPRPSSALFPHLFSRHLVRPKRTTRDFSKLLERRLIDSFPLKGWCIEKNRRVQAYVLLSPTPRGGFFEAVEFAGEPREVLNIFRFLLQKKKVQEIQASPPPWGAWERAWFSFADRVTFDTRACMVKVFDPYAVLEAFSNILKKRAQGLPRKAPPLVLGHPSGKSVRLTFHPFRIAPGQSSRDAATLDFSGWTTLLFGAPFPSRRLALPKNAEHVADTLFPLPFYWWRTDWI